METLSHSTFKNTMAKIIRTRVLTWMKIITVLVLPTYCYSFHTYSSTMSSIGQSKFLARTNTFSTTTSSPQQTTNHRHRHRPTNNMITMGMEIKIRIVGKKNGGEQWLDDAYSVYSTRLKPSSLDVETLWHKNDDDLIKGITSDSKKGHVICFLDPLGKTCTSEKFSEDLYQWLELGGSRLSFIIGGAEGLPSIYKQQIYAMGRNNKSSGTLEQTNWKVLSLSDLTFTHQFARTLLMEQIYRASEIRKGKWSVFFTFSVFFL